MGSHRRREDRLEVGDAKLDGDAGIVISPDRRLPTPGRLRPDPHQLLKPLDLVGFDLYSPLALGSTLEVVDGDRATAKHERAAIRLGKPVVDARPGNAQAAGCFSRG